MFEKLVAERREANDATVIVGDPDLKILEDDVADPLPCFLLCVDSGRYVISAIAARKTSATASASAAAARRIRMRTSYQTGS